MPKLETAESIEQGSGNIFADLGCVDAEERRFKAFLGMQISSIIDSRCLNQTEAAQLLGITQPKVSKIKHGKLDAFSVEKLMHFLMKLNRNIEIRILDNASSNTPAHIKLMANDAEAVIAA
jgi:predicted XRE-type DNA-binding protein